jgi:hypothetical protein
MNTHEVNILIFELEHMLEIISYTASDLSLQGAGWTQDANTTIDKIHLLTKKARAHLKGYAK